MGRAERGRARVQRRSGSARAERDLRQRHGRRVDQDRLESHPQAQQNL